jgi:4-hydroxy-3-methylbut-2-enyl diphosphate reductase
LKIIVSKYAGFCFGVKRAVNITEETLLKKDNVFSFGPIIHNNWVVKKLSDKGLKLIKSFSKRKKKDTIVLPSHGIDAKKICKYPDIDFVDTTCPFVKKAQNLIKELDETGYEILILGDKNHTEVKGFVSIANGKAKVFDNKVELKRYIPKKRKVAFLSQTTQSVERFSRMSEELLTKDLDELRICNTICKDSQNRQLEALKTAKKADIVIVIGGKHSANTKRLTGVCAKVKKTYHIESEDEIKKTWLKGVKSVGIVTGASTPGKFIYRVKAQINRLETERS